MKLVIPEEIRVLAAALAKAGFEAYLVGGCLRDLLLGQEPKDWDIATSASPEEIQKLFSTFAHATADKPATIYENEFGTVSVKTGAEDERLKIVEITTFRKEGRYTDKRHPDEVIFAQTIEEDLARRDFTVNAIALNLKSQISNLKTKDDEIELGQNEIIDPYDGQEDLKNKIIRTVGKAEERFNEDALRLLRAVRLAVELESFSAAGGPASGWEIDLETRRAIEVKAGLLEMIAKERIRDELVKIIMTDRAASGIRLLEELDLLRYVLPELREGLGVGQNLHHIYTVFEHNLRSLDYAVKQNYSLPIRLAALLHDAGKPRTKQGEGYSSTFHGHEVVGARLTYQALDRLRFSKDLTSQVGHLVRHHMFYYNVHEVTASGVRRFLARVGPENIPDLIKLREADRIGSGVPKAVPYKLRHLLFMIAKVKNDPISPKMLKMNGTEVMEVLGIPPGPRVGQILAVLLEEVLDDPAKNEADHLVERIRALGKLSDQGLGQLAERARAKKEEFESGIEEGIKKKYFVK